MIATRCGQQTPVADLRRPRRNRRGSRESAGEEGRGIGENGRGPEGPDEAHGGTGTALQKDEESRRRRPLEGAGDGITREEKQIVVKRRRVSGIARLPPGKEEV